jgi:HK97 family phage prohead protease
MPAKSYAAMSIKGLSEDGTFEGLLASYNTVDLGGDRILPGAFTKTMQERGSEVPMLWQHDSHQPIGKLVLSDSPDGLKVKGIFSMTIPLAQHAYDLLKDGVIKGLSIGYDAVKDSYDDGVRQLKEVRLWEGSVVTFPMNTACMVTSLKTMNEGGSDRSPSIKLSAVDEIVERVNALAGKISVKEGRKLSAATKKTLGSAKTHANGIAEHVKGLNDCFDALFSDGADDDTEDMDAGDPVAGGDDTPKGGAAPEVKTEPVEDHSADAETITGLISLIRKA